MVVAQPCPRHKYNRFPTTRKKQNTHTNYAVLLLLLAFGILEQMLKFYQNSLICRAQLEQTFFLDIEMVPEFWVRNSVFPQNLFPPSPKVPAQENNDQCNPSHLTNTPSSTPTSASSLGHCKLYCAVIQQHVCSMHGGGEGGKHVGGGWLL